MSSALTCIGASCTPDTDPSRSCLDKNHHSTIQSTASYYFAYPPIFADFIFNRYRSAGLQIFSLLTVVLFGTFAFWGNELTSCRELLTVSPLCEMSTDESTFGDETKYQSDFGFVNEDILDSQGKPLGFTVIEQNTIKGRSKKNILFLLCRYM